ncbi:GGDEF domain-containing protein [Hydrogenophaga soli]
MKIVETLRRWASEDAQVQAAAARRNLHVLGVAAWVLLALNGVHVLVFSLLRFDLPQQTAWAHQIAWAHASMAVLMVAVGGLTRRAQAQPEVGNLGRWLPEVTSLGVLLWAVALTLMDQAIGSGISAFINASLAVGMVLLLRPRTTLLLQLSAWLVLALLLGWTTDDPARLTTLRMNAATACALALLVSTLLWRRYVQAELLQRALADTNRQLEQQRAELETLATRDPLTGVFNRREFVHRAQQALAQAQRHGHELAVLMVDLDHFKSVNDRFGHPVGDEVLRQVTRLMLQNVRQTDCLARLGGEEFALLLPCTPASNALHLADKLRQKLADTPIEPLGEPITASLGLSCLTAGQQLTLDTLLQRADQALYRAKELGRNRTEVWTDTP